MNPNLASTYVAESPKRTGLLIFGVTTLVVGLAFVVKYLVEKDRKDAGYPDMGESKMDVISRTIFTPNSDRPQRTEPMQGQIAGLLEGLFDGSINPDNAEAYAEALQNASTIAVNVGCNPKYNKQQEIDEFNPSSNINKCGKAVYEFQEYLDMTPNGRYDTQTLIKHKAWLSSSNQG